MTIFHLQQAMELAVKGLARASGYGHETVKAEYGHNYFDLFFSLLEDIVLGSSLIGVINEVLSVFYVEGSSYDAPSHLSNVRDHLSSPKSNRAKLTDADWRAIYLSAFRMGVDEVDRLVRLYDSVSRDQAISFGALVVVREQMALNRDVPVDAVSASEASIEFEKRFPLLRPILGLFIFGCIFWPHNIPARYPAYPEADRDVFQVSQFGWIGVRHYSDDLGVVRRLKDLLGCCEGVVKGLIDG